MTDPRPNIVLVTVDSLRADRCGFARNGDPATPTLTPTLDRMASEGVVFENAVAPGPATPASMPVSFTGQYPVSRGETGSELGRRRERIRTHMTARETLPEMLGKRGYATAAFTPNPFTSRYFGFDRGFDRFEDFMDESRRGRMYDRVFRGFLRGDTSRSFARVLVNLAQREEVFKPWEQYFDEIRSYVERAPEPYFLWVFLMDAHNPYLAPRDHRSQSWWAAFHANYRFWRESHETPFSETVHDRLVTAYDDAVGYVDAFLDRLQAHLGDRTTTVVHGDHGEAFGEHGSYGHGPHLWEENVHVPLLVHGAGGSGSVTRPVSLRRLPALLRRVSSGKELGAVAGPVAYSRTFDAERELLRGRDWRCLVDRDGRTVEWRRDGRTVEGRRDGEFVPVAGGLDGTEGFGTGVAPAGAETDVDGLGTMGVSLGSGRVGVSHGPETEGVSHDPGSAGRGPDILTQYLATIAEARRENERLVAATNRLAEGETL